MSEQSSTMSKPRREVPDVDPFEPAIAPAWVRERYPSYAGSAHAAGPISTDRILQVKGRAVRVRTTYEVFLDDRPLPLHLMVDSDGRLWSHVCPYETFATATELVQYVLDRVPEALDGLDEHPHTHPGEHSPGGHR